MILFLSEGRLGNQIFQYLFLKTIQKEDEKIVVVGFEELLNVFNVSGIFNINKKNSLVTVFVYKLLKPFLNFISDKKLLSFYSVQYDYMAEYRKESTKYRFISGFFKRIKFIKLGFFQSENFFTKELVSNLIIKQEWIIESEKYLNPMSGRYKVFVHIRRKDYQNFKVFGQNTLLPMSYFHNQIKWFLNNKNNVYFIFLSDEPEFIENEFSYLDNKIISKNCYEVDFAIMTKCNGAILSPSSFGWWGSYLMKNRDTVFVPKYWLGFNAKIDYHNNPIPSFAIEVSI